MPPRSGNPMATGCVACALELASWIYGAASFIVVSVTFPSICHLQILRLREFAAVFRKESEGIAVLGGHLRLRRQLRVHQPPLPGVFMDGDGDGDGEPICGGSGHHPPPLLRQPLQHRRARGLGFCYETLLDTSNTGSI
ncbi:extracellular ligand-gated ion channel [Musa troglodytarum]|uniref:Extracellular ligand-gated ion channel n=1 Tax=Musa troglodytarum TaxID=320322 RepID=A0A9E7FFC5_9LILI|nr:extracellular ligand-gated ion channel [Musa troglodytarum]